MLPVETFLRPPVRVGEHVRAFCSRVSPVHAPVYVGASSLPGTRAGMCFHNVRQLCQSLGGEAEYGWLIWEWQDTYIEAEHHAVWRCGEDRIEVTPRQPHHDQVLFLPDPARAYDFDGRRRVDNVRMPLRSDAAVREYLALAARAVDIEETNSTGDEVVLTAQQAMQLELIQWKKQRIEADLMQWSASRRGRNETCWCGSGRKLKHCCAGLTPKRGPAMALLSA